MARPGDTAAALARVAARLTTTTSNSAAASHALSSWQVLSPHSPSCSSSSSRSPWQPLPGWPPHSGYASSAARRPPPEGAQASRGGNSSGSSSSSSSNDRSRQLPALTRYGHDLTEEARRGLLDPVIGRADVIQRTMQVLLRRTKHNPLLIGEAGVGKTAIVEGIAQLMAAPNPPKGLAGKRLIALDVAAVVAGSTYRGEFEERLQSLLHDCEAAQGSIVLFCDEIHTLVGAGNVHGGLDFANMLKPALARSQLQVIGATTLDEYRQHIETDPALSRRFQPILVEEPTAQECLQLLQGLAPRYEAFHSVRLPTATLAAAVTAAQRFIRERRLPDSALDLVDEAAAKVRLAAAYDGSSKGQAGTGSSSSTPGQPSSSSSALGSWWSGSSNSSTEKQDSTPVKQQQQPPPQGLDARQASFWDEWQQQQQQEEVQATAAAAAAAPTPQAEPPPTAMPAASPAPAGAVAAAGVGAARVASQQPPPASPTSWSGWVTAKGWQGEAEVHRQQLLEWFGATHQQPLKGVAGHQQTTQERRRKHAQLFGSGTQAVPGSPTAAATAAGPIGGRGGASSKVDYSAKSCPHCGTVVLPEHCADPVRLRCHHCGFRFLNVAPDKLQLGTSVLLHEQPPVQQARFGQLGQAPASQEQQQRQSAERSSSGGHHHSLSDAPPDVAGGGSSTATWSPSAQQKRTAVAVQPRAADSSRQQQEQPLPRPAAHTPDSTQPARGSLAPAAHLGSSGSSGPEVTPQDVLDVVAEATGIPRHLLGAGLPAAPGAAGAAAAKAAARQELGSIHAVLSSAIKGQDAAIASVIGSLRLSRLGLTPQQLSGGGSSSTGSARQDQPLQDSPDLLQSCSRASGSARPALSLLFTGPSGVGKSSLARTLAEALLPGEPQGILILSCGELAERHSVSRLIGAPPGYVGFGKGGLLTEAIRRRPYSVVVFDDVERAHPDVVGLLLQAAETGYLMDSMGHAINLRSTVLLFTANSATAAGTPLASRAQPVPSGTAAASVGSSVAAAVRGFSHLSGFGSEGAELEPDEAPQPQHTSSTAQAQPAAGVAARAPPSPSSAMVAELGSRVDETIPLQPLNPDGMAAILQQQLQHAVEQAAHQGVLLHVEPAALSWLAAAGCSGSAGARPLGQLIRRHVLVPLAAALMDDGTHPHDAAGGAARQAAAATAAAAAAADSTPGMWAAAVLSMHASGGGFAPQLNLVRL